MRNNNTLLLFALSLMAFLLNVDYTAVNLALVTMSHNLNSSLHESHWLLSGYMLAWAGVVIPMGRLQDYYGARLMFIMGLLLFVLGSLITALAPNMAVCISGRIVQGIAGAFYAPASYALIYQYIPEKKRGSAMGKFSVGVGLGMALGPTLGGVILSALSWRWIFFINIPISLLCLFLMRYSTEQMLQENKDFKLDYMSSVLFSIVVIGTLLSASWISHTGMRLINGLTLLMSVACLIIFVLRQTNNENALIPRKLFNNPPYVAILLSIFIEQFAFSASIVLIALYLQSVVGFSALFSSLVFLALNLTFAVVSPVTGRIIDKFGIKKLAVASFMLLGFSFLVFSCLSSKTTIGPLVAVLVMMGACMGVAFNAFNAGVVLVIDQTLANISMSVFMLCALLGNVLSVIITTACYIRVSAMQLMQQLGDTAKHVTLSNLMAVVAHLGHVGDVWQSFNPKVQKGIKLYLTGSLLHGIHFVAIVACILQCIGALVCWQKLKS